LGDRWPPPAIRREMLEEAVGVIRRLWQGKSVDHRGRHYTVEDARLYTRPEEPPPLLIAASGTAAAELAGRMGDGLIATAPRAETVQAFERAGGRGKARYAELTVCWARDEAEARRIAVECWPIVGMEGQLTSELRLPAYFEQAARMVREDDLTESVVCGPDPARHLAGIRQFEEAGFDHVWVHQIGPDQEGFFRVYAYEIIP